MSTPTVKISKDQHVRAFKADMQPVITVDPGTVIEIETWDCFTGQVQSESDTVEKLDLTRINSATGPIAVKGARTPVTHTLMNSFADGNTSKNASLLWRN